MAQPADDAALRAAALSHIAALENKYGALSWRQIEPGFEFRGERVLVATKAKGIFKPRQLSTGALSIRTAEPRRGRVRRYDDNLASDADYFHYRMQDGGPNNPDNAICSLHHDQLLDAAHIIPDREARGDAHVPNGLALCKLHHAAFDGLLIGITPDCQVRVQQHLLDEIDGPMLEHGLRAFHEQQLILPKELADQPDRDLLAEQWESFAA